MAEEIVWNKKLLLVSLLLGVLAVILFYSYDWRMQRKLRGETVRVLRWRRSLSMGEPIAEADIERAPIPRAMLKQLDNVLQDQPVDLEMLSGAYVTCNVRKGEFVLGSHVIDNPSAMPSARISDGMRAFTLQVDPNTTQGDMLHIDDRVDVIGLVSIGNQPPKAYPILKNVRVLAVGGRSAPPEEDVRVEPKGRRSTPTERTYRSVTVEVTPETATQLVDLLARIYGNVRIALRPPSTGRPDQEAGTLNPELLPVLKQPVRGQAEGG